MLDDMDKDLMERFGNCYFRYVDDLIVVCPPDQVGNVISAITASAGTLNLSLHDGKADVVTASAWLNECPSGKGPSKSDSFDQLISDLSLYLGLWPDQLPALREAFKSGGHSLPMNRLATLSKYGPFLRFVRQMRRKTISRVTQIAFGKQEHFVERANRIRDDMRQAVDRAGNEALRTDGMRRRWFVQKYRYILNRLLYLNNQHTYDGLLSQVPLGSEFSEYRILLKSLMSNDSSEIIRLPGRVLATFCELAGEQELPIKPKELPSLGERATAEGATMLAVYFGWKPPESSLTKMYAGGRILLEIFAGVVTKHGEIQRLSYLDEMELLLRGLTNERFREIVRTRFSEGEAIGLEGLWLGGGYAAS